MIIRALLGCAVVCGVILYKAPSREGAVATDSVDAKSELICRLFLPNHPGRTKSGDAARAKNCSCAANVLKGQMGSADFFDVMRQAADFTNSNSGKTGGEAIKFLQKHRAILKWVEERCGINSFDILGG